MAFLEEDVIRELLTNFPFKDTLAGMPNPYPTLLGMMPSNKPSAPPPAQGPMPNRAYELSQTAPDPRAVGHDLSHQAQGHFDMGGSSSQDRALSDPAYRAMIARDLLSQGKILAKTDFGPRWVAPDTPNAQLDREALLSMIGTAPLRDQQGNPTPITGGEPGPGRRHVMMSLAGSEQGNQPSRGSFSVMGGPQIGTLGDLAQVQAVISKLPPAFQSLILQRLTGLSDDQNALNKAMMLERFKHQLASPEREAVQKLREIQAMSAMKKAEADEVYKNALMQQRGGSSGLQVMGLMKDLIEKRAAAMGPGGSPEAAQAYGRLLNVLNQQFIGAQAGMEGMPIPQSTGRAPATPQRGRRLAPGVEVIRE